MLFVPNNSSEMIAYIRFLCALMVVHLFLLGAFIYWDVNYGSTIGMDIYHEMKDTAYLHKEEMAAVLRQIREHRAKDIVAERLMFSEESIKLRLRNLHALEELKALDNRIIANQRMIIANERKILKKL